MEGHWLDGARAQQKVRAPVPTSTAWVYCSSRSSILEMGRAGWDFLTLLLEERRVLPRSPHSASGPHPEQLPQLSRVPDLHLMDPLFSLPLENPGSCFPWRTLGPDPLENPGACLPLENTGSFFPWRTLGPASPGEPWGLLPLENPGCCSPWRTLGPAFPWRTLGPVSRGEPWVLLPWRP